MGVRVVVTEALPDAVSMIMLDSNQVGADPGTLTLDSSRVADIRMDSEASDGAGELVSLFQTNCVALKTERTFAVEPLRASAVCLVSELSA
jgi:hypothetical protein